MNAQDRRTQPQFTPAGGGSVRRRAQRVVVRAGEAAEQREDWSPIPPDVVEDRRRPMPTLVGLGEEAVVGEPEQPSSDRGTLPNFTFDFEASGEDLVTPSHPRVTLRDGVDDATALAYREEAELIIASGVFPKADQLGDPIDETPPPPAAIVALGQRLG